MSGYVVNFTVYTMAMLGLIRFAVFVYKKVMEGGLQKNNTKFLSVEETMSLNPRKTLHVIRAGNERFLIAADIDKTTLISKLENNNTSTQKSFDRFMNTEKEINSIYPHGNEISANKALENMQIQLESLNSAQKTISRQTKQNLDKSEFNQSMMQEIAKKINEL